nr:hypothetical protein [uncultured Catonella sp.]
MYDFVIESLKKIINSYSDDFINKLKKSIEDKCIEDDLMNKALEGEKFEEVNIELKMLVEKVCREANSIDDTSNKDHIRNDFERYVKELADEEYFDESNKEALFQRFKIFVEGYKEYISNQISIGEKYILKKVGIVSEEVANIEKKIVAVKNVQEKMQEKMENADKLNKDKNAPLIDINKHYIKVEPYNSKYEVLDNTFKLVEEIDPFEADNIYVFTLNLKNISEELIKKISIKNFKVMLCAEDEENPTSGYLVCNIIEHRTQSVECYLNLLKGSEQKIHLIIEDKGYELNEGNPNYDEKFKRDRLWIEFDMKLTNDSEEADYSYSIFASRDRMSENISDRYCVDSVEMCKN